MDDCLNLQFDLDSFVAFFDRLGLTLNLAKSKRSAYHLHNSLISRCDGFVLDLDLKLSDNLNPGIHI